MSSLKVALVYDRVNTKFGGAENVLLALHELFPKAPLYTFVYDSKKAVWAKSFKVIPSFVNKIPFANKLHRYLAWLAPLAFESFDLSGFDLVISITSAEAKGVITNASQTHICYLLTPPRYLYQDKNLELESKIWLKWPVIKQLANLLIKYLTWWDQAAIHRPDFIIPISNKVKARVKKFYNLNTEPVIYPPINSDVKILHPTSYIPNSYYLIISRLVPYKRLDLAIKAFNQLSKKLIIIGEGPQFSKLTKMANKNIQFLGSVNQEKLNQLLANCTALVMPQIEDFGIAALEANAHLKPVIIHKSSGACELITDRIHGVWFNNQNARELIKAVATLESLNFDKNKLKANALKYQKNIFISNFKDKICSKTKISMP
jgi:glycosyltransferase involved in cell wall biosynthesis